LRGLWKGKVEVNSSYRRVTLEVDSLSEEAGVLLKGQ
jgi:hypothetical protein